jgi:polar amino acid transport system substrate-binding protein
MTFRALASVVGLLLSLAAPTLSHAQSRTVRFVTDKEKDGGFLLAISRAAMEKMGYQVDVEYLPWARALAQVMEGRSEALLGAQYTDERAAKMQYTDVVGLSEMVFFKLKETRVPYQRLEDLQGLTVGTIAQSAYTPEFDSATYFKKDPAPDYLTNIDKLLDRRIPLFVEKKYVVLNTLRTRFPDAARRVDTLRVPLKELKFFDCFSKASPGYAQKVKDFNAGLALIMKDGTYRAIMDKGMHE